MVEGVDRHPRSVGYLAPGKERGSPITDGSQGEQGSSPQPAGEPSVHTRVLRADFLAAGASTKRTLVEKLARSWSLAPVDFAEPTPVNEEQVAIAEVKLSPHCFMLFIFSLPYLNVPSLFQPLGRALNLARSRPSVSTWEGQIRDLESSDALPRGQINDLQVECKRSDERKPDTSVAWRKLKREKETLGAEKKDLQHQLEAVSYTHLTLPTKRIV